MKNENVFDITKGVCISLFVKNSNLSKGIWYSEVWGSRLAKYQFVANYDFHDIAWQEVECVPPYFFFRPIDWSVWDEYESGWPIADSLNPSNKKTQLFDIYVLGFQSHRDHFAISFERTVMESRAREMLDFHLSDEEFLAKYRVKNNRDWNIFEARNSIRENKRWIDKIIRCAYRPFDNPYCYFGYEFMDYPRRDLLDNVANQENVALVVPRQIGSAHWRHVFVAEGPANDCLVSDQTREACYVFPIWRYGVDGLRHDNLSSKFLQSLEDLYDRYYSSEEVLGYIYSVLFSPTYRTRYAEYLRIDFPRIPLPENAGDFENLSSLGWALVKAHLLEGVLRRGLADYHGRGDHKIEGVRYSADENAIHINKTQHFKPVPKAVWEFHIGGYQVLDKYLKSRKGRTLTLDEIGHVARVADSLAFTIDQMAAIDIAYKAAFETGDRSD